jgi:hypothetical protein
MQVALFNKDIIVRGGLCVGQIVANGAETFGPALVRAYELESKVAKWPRIVLDSPLLDHLLASPLLRRHTIREERAYIDKLVSRDSDGQYYVDYLRGSADEFDDYSSYLHFLESHRRVILAALKNEANEGVLEKYRWLARKQNEMVGYWPREQLEYYGYSPEELLIS